MKTYPFTGSMDGKFYFCPTFTIITNAQQPMYRSEFQQTTMEPCIGKSQHSGRAYSKDYDGRDDYRESRCQENSLDDEKGVYGAVYRLVFAVVYAILSTVLSPVTKVAKSSRRSRSRSCSDRASSHRTVRERPMDYHNVEEGYGRHPLLPQKEPICNPARADTYQPKKVVHFQQPPRNRLRPPIGRIDIHSTAPGSCAASVGSCSTASTSSCNTTSSSSSGGILGSAAYPMSYAHNAYRVHRSLDRLRR